jgi:hypothetical protein
LVGGILLRVLVALAFGHPYDFEIWRSVVRLFWGFHVNPFFLWSQGPLSLIALELTHAPVAVVRGLGLGEGNVLENLLLHVPFIVGDLLVGLAIVRLVDGCDPRWRRRALSAWAFLPGFWWVSAGHGQIDPWIPATVLFAVYAASRRSWTAVGLWLALGFGFKYVPVIVVPGFVCFAFRQQGYRAARRVVLSFSLGSAAALVPLAVSVAGLGFSRGASLLYTRVAWWSVGTSGDGGTGMAVLSTDALAKAYHSPYPAVLALLKSADIGVPVATKLPPVLVVAGVLASLAWFVPRVMRAAPVDRAVQDPADQGVIDLLTYAGLTLLFVGGLSQVAVIQRVYWALPLMLVSAVLRRAPAGFGLALQFSHLLLLPIMFVESPLFYLRPPWDYHDAGSLVRSFAEAAGLGRSPQLALIIGAVLVPVGLASFFANGGVPRAGRWRGAILGVAAGWALLPLLRPSTVIVLALATPLALFSVLGARVPRRNVVSTLPLLAGLMVCVAATVLQPWAAHQMQP